MQLRALQGDSRHAKHDRLVLGIAAGQGLVGRLQCKGLTAVNGAHEADATYVSCLPMDREVVSFVTFFVQSESLEHNDKQVVNEKAMELGNFTTSRADRPFIILNIFLESIQMSMPGTVTTILTDQVSHIPTNRLPMDVHIHRGSGNFTRTNLMLQRLESYIEFLDKHLASRSLTSKHEEAVEHIIFTDSDIIIVGDLGCVFKNHTTFDIALTFRNNKDQPINSGVIMVRGLDKNVLRARSFLMKVVKVYKAKFARAARMLGDQLSLAWIVQNHSYVIASKFKKPISFETQISRTQVLFLPALMYNWTPSEGAGQFHGMPEHVKVLHFKGSRKRLMIEAWNFYKQSQTGLSDMKCLVLSSGRTKYDF